MDFSLTEEQIQLRDMLRGFAEERIAPRSRQWDEECWFPAETLGELAALGLAGIYVFAAAWRLRTWPTGGRAGV